METTLDDYKLRCELLGHSLDVRSVEAGADTPEGQIIISGSRDKTVKVWKPLDNEYSESVTYRDHKNFVACVYYLKSEGWICTGSNDATICIYSEGGYVPILTLKGHESTVCAIAGGLSSQSIISGSWDATARIWTIDDTGGISFVVLKGHESAVWAVASMSDSNKYLTGSADKTILYWNDKGEKLRMLRGHTDCVRALLTLPNSALVSAANDAILRYWNEDGECVRELTGHTNYIYSIAHNTALGDNVIVSCGEDSTLRMWNVLSGKELGAPLVHPVESIWSVVCLNNGDIVTGSNDGIVRVFTKDSAHMAKPEILKAYEQAIAMRAAQMNEELGGIKKTDLPGPESLLTNGTRDGQTKMVRFPDGSVKCYSWEFGKWNLVGEVTGATGGSQTQSGKILYEGKEYDYVFSVDISDGVPPLKLPYNRGEDPWQIAQKFIHKNDLPQAYLEQVANFIVKNSGGANNPTAPAATTGYQDPFTGGARYVPGSSNTNVNSYGNADPFTGSSSYTTSSSRHEVNFVKGSDKHFPVGKYVTFDSCDPVKVLEKLKEFNQKLSSNDKVPQVMLDAVINLTEDEPDLDATNVEALNVLLKWPSDVLFPILDITRLAIRKPIAFTMLDSLSFLDLILPQLNGTPPNQLMTIRCFANMMIHAAGRQKIHALLSTIVEQINQIKSGSINLQIAISTFYLNVTVWQTLGMAEKDKCAKVTDGIIHLLKWATDLEACYRSMQAIGNLTTTPFGQSIAAQVISADIVMDRIRELTKTPQSGGFEKINLVGNELLAAF